MVGTNTLIATPLARPPWSAAADARLFLWDGVSSEQDPTGPGPLGFDPNGPGPAAIARVNSGEALAGALRCGVAAVWAGRAVDPAAAIAAFGALSGDTAQLILEVANANANANANADGSGPGFKAELAALARLAMTQGLAPGRLVLEVPAEPRVDLPAALASWRADTHLRRHRLIVVIPTATPPATGAGLVAAAVMARAAVATDDVRGARRVLEVLLTIEQHRRNARPDDCAQADDCAPADDGAWPDGSARPDDEGELR